jgi:hypothetical protein
LPDRNRANPAVVEIRVFTGAEPEEHALCVTEEMRLIRVLALSRMLLDTLNDDAADYPIETGRLKAHLRALRDHADRRLGEGASQQRNLRVVADSK